MNTAAFSALINLLYLTPTLYMMQIYDRVVPTGGLATLFWLTVLVAIAIGTLTSLDEIRARLMIRASLALDHQLSGRVLGQLLKEERPDSSASLMREFDTLRQTLTGPAIMAMFDIPWTPIYLIVAFIIHPALGLMICLAGAILVAIAIINERVIRERGSAGYAASATAQAFLESLHAKAESVRAFGMRHAMVLHQQRLRAEGLAASAQAQLSSTRYLALTKFVRMFMQSLSLCVGAWLAIKGGISVGTIIAGSVLLSRALQPIEQFIAAWPSLVQADLALSRLNKLFEKVESAGRRRTALPEPRGIIEVSRVTLRNQQRTAYILQDVSLSLVPGEFVGLVGQSGAGKSSLARILAGAIAPDSGEVRIDHASYADWEPEQLARHIGFMSQDTVLYMGTIGENISRFAAAREDAEDRDIIDRKVVAASKLAGIHEIILHMPSGYETCIGGPAFRMSGGQEQRVALARALYDDPKLLILDEPSAALDALGEQALIRAVAGAKQRGAAILMISHRSSVLNTADRLIVLNNGTIEHVGPRQAVIAELRDAAARENVVKFSGR